MPAQTEKGSRAVLWIPLLLVASVLGFALGGFCVYFYVRGNDTPPPDRTAESSTALGPVVALGRIEPRDGILSLGVPNPDRIREIEVEEDDLVVEGQTLAVLDSEAMRKLDIDIACIQRAQADKRRKAIEANGKAQIHVEEVRRDQIRQLEPIEMRALQSKIEFLKAQKENAEQNCKRYVAAGDTVADQDREKQELALRQVQTELTATECRKDKLHESTALNLKVANAQLEAARAELKQNLSAISLDLLDTQVQQARERLEETRILAPRDGKILRISVHEGELVHGQTILQMANIDNMIVLTEVYETDITRVKPGQKATVTSPLFPKGKNALTGEVIWVASTVGKAQVISLDPRAAVDNRVVEVKVELDQPRRVAKLIGHQVLVTIDTGPDEGSR